MSAHQRSRAALVVAVSSFILVATAAAQPSGNTGGSRSSDPNATSGVRGKQTGPLVVPLPAAALAGIGTLAGVIGLSVLRRRRHTQH